MSSIIDENEVSIGGIDTIGESNNKSKPRRKCTHVFTRGAKINAICDRWAYEEDMDLCKPHRLIFEKKNEKQAIKNNIEGQPGRCQYEFTRGERKGTFCGKKTLEDSEFCGTHTKKENTVIGELEKDKCFFVLKSGKQCSIKKKNENNDFCTRHSPKDNTNDEEKKPAPKKAKSKKATEEIANDSDDKPVVKKTTKAAKATKPKPVKEAKPAKETKPKAKPAKKKEKDDILEKSVKNVKKNIDDCVVDRNDIIEVEDEEEDEKPAPKKKSPAKKVIVKKQESEDEENEDEDEAELSELSDQE